MFTGEATPNLGLPQWEPGNHPEFLTDMNDAFKAIDANAKADDEGVMKLEERMENIEEQAEQQQNAISAINTVIDTYPQLTEDVADLKASNSESRTRIATVEDKVEELENTTTSQGTALNNLDREIDKVQVALNANGISTQTNVMQDKAGKLSRYHHTVTNDKGSFGVLVHINETLCFVEYIASFNPFTSDTGTYTLELTQDNKQSIKDFLLEAGITNFYFHETSPNKVLMLDSNGENIGLISLTVAAPDAWAKATNMDNALFRFTCTVSPGKQYDTRNYYRSINFVSNNILT